MSHTSCMGTTRRRLRTSKIHRSLRFVYPPACDASLRLEAQITCDWLLRHAAWNGSNVIHMRLEGEGESELTVSFFPITDHPDQPQNNTDAEYFLGSDAHIYHAAHDGRLSIFEIRPTLDSENDVEYIIEKLRLIRGE
jgi:hypothetical protein